MKTWNFSVSLTYTCNSVHSEQWTEAEIAGANDMTLEEFQALSNKKMEAAIDKAWQEWAYQYVDGGFDLVEK